jgi:CheY-like chemotaxis protein
MVETEAPISVSSVICIQFGVPGTRILCVDDDLAVLRSLEGVLLYSGFKVSAVASVSEALTLISKHPFDVLLTDLNIGNRETDSLL